MSPQIKNILNDSKQKLQPNETIFDIFKCLASDSLERYILSYTDKFCGKLI